jgi:hypothetical protein
MTETVQELTEAEGRWWVITQGSEHLFDFENQVYVRHQLDGLNPLEYDRTPMVLDPALIGRWPRVGSYFQMFLPMTIEGEMLHMKYRESSQIREIRRVEPS